MHGLNIAGNTDINATRFTKTKTMTFVGIDTGKHAREYVIDAVVRAVGG